METEKQELTCWGFNQELLKLPSICRKLSNKTARQKVQAVYDKYSSLLSYSVGEKNYFKLKFERQEKIISAHKTGTIEVLNGFYKISEIASARKRTADIAIVFKNGTEVTFTLDFEWIIDLYKNN